MKPSECVLLCVVIQCLSRVSDVQKIIDDCWNVLMKCDFAKLCATF